MVNPKNGSMVSQSIFEIALSLAFMTAPVSLPPFQRGDLTDLQIHFTGADQRAHLLDAVGSGAEIVAPVQQRHALGNRMQIERPVERGIAAADDQDILVAELLHLAHGVKHGGAFIGLDARHRRALGLERAAARGDHHHLALEHLAGVGGDAKAGVADLLDRLHHLVEMEGRMERLDLLQQRLRQAMAGDEGDAGNVVDRLFRVELGALAADLVEDIDQMRLHVEQAQFEHGEQSAGARANNQHIGFDRFAHISFFSFEFDWDGCACLAKAEGSGKP
jgi:hypothetical protein